MSNESILPPLREQVVNWMNQKNFTRSSFERLISNIPGAGTYDQLRLLCRDNPNVFRVIQIKGGAEGLALNLPASEISWMPKEEQLQVEAISDIPMPQIPMTIDSVTSAPPPTPARTPEEDVRYLISRAANVDVSGSSQNYAQAALMAAQALLTIQELDRQRKL